MWSELPVVFLYTWHPAMKFHRLAILLLPLAFGLVGVSACCGPGRLTGGRAVTEWRRWPSEWHIQVLRHGEAVLDAMLVVAWPDAATASVCRGHIRFAVLDCTGIKLLEGAYIGNGGPRFSGILSRKSYGKRLGRAILDVLGDIRQGVCRGGVREQELSSCRPFGERVQYGIEDGRKLIRVSWPFNNTRLLIREAGRGGGI